MTSKALNPQDYIAELPLKRQDAMQKLRVTLTNNLPMGFEEIMQYGMISYVVPHTIYPKGYHCKPKDALPFLSIASQKNNISIYHMGIYAIPELLDWFVAEYPKHIKTKLDMGKSCMRFKKMETIPYALIGELASKMTPADWIKTYETKYRK